MLKRSLLLKRVVPIILACTLLLVGAGYPNEEKATPVTAAAADTAPAAGEEIYYSEAQKQYAAEGYTPYEGDNIEAKITDASLVNPHSFDGEEHIGVMWDGEQDEVSYTVEAPRAGLYQIGCVYRPLGDNGAPVTRSLAIDGKIPFQEALSLEFLRAWRDTNAPLKDVLGNDVKPFSKEIPKFTETLLQDSGGKYASPLQVYLTEGTHTVTFGYIDEPMFIEKVYLAAPKALPTYKEVMAENADKKGDGKTVTFEAENYDNVVEKSDSVIGIEYSGDPAASPAALYEVKMNYIGGGGFKDGNQSITWKFAVETDGYYKLALRVAQWYNDGLPSFRQILLDGEVPFKEFECYSFAYNDKWYSEELSDSEGNPYLLWLQSGEHTLTLTVKMGAYAGIEETLYRSTQDLSKLIRRIKLVTGENPDGNYDYEIERNIPGVVSDLKALKTNLIYCETVARDLAGKKSSMSNSFDSVVEQLDELIEDPDRIPKRLGDMETTLGNLGSWITSIKTVPLGIDWISVAAPDEEIPDKKATVFQYVWYWIVKLVDSFTKDYQSVSVVDTGITADTELDVWVSRGADWSRLIKQMADANFTPDSNAIIKLNMIPAGQIAGVNPVMLSVASGNAPDVVLGVGSSIPLDYAVRNAVVDLSKLEGFDEVKASLHNPAFTMLEYQGGTYGLPETVSFRCMYYRTDIFEEIGLTTPDTWDEFYDTTLPVLYQNGLKCYIPMVYDIFLFQNGGTYYTEDGHYSALDTEEAFKAFKETCELNINYSIPIAVSYFTRFRTGELPLLLGTSADYLTFESAAPEISGNWGIAPLPATVKEDGSLNRSSSGASVDCGVIMKQSEHVDKAWEFLKWWMSGETQKTFANQIENQLGITARYFTANMEAFSALPFSRDEFKVINTFFESNVESRNVLGGYYTSRHLTNAWTRCVENGEDFRDSLEEAVEEINIELRRKQIEYGIFPE